MRRVQQESRRSRQRNVPVSQPLRRLENDLRHLENDLFGAFFVSNYLYYYLAL
jgi:hypothetical protein